MRTETDARAVLREVLVAELRPDLDRSIKALPHADKPSVLLVVGVNGTGKTTTVGKLARVLVADGRRVVLGAADTFRAAAADQLQSWASRVGAQVVRGPEGADPASVAFDAVDTGIAAGADVVVIDTAGRLHTKTGLMDELGKVKRVVSRRDEVERGHCRYLADREAGGPMPSADEIRDAQRATWAGLSAGWEKWDSVIMDQLGPVGAAMIERLDIAEDQQHLDIASGTGEPGLSIARLSPKGRVVLTDLVAEMLDVAARRAERARDHQHRDEGVQRRRSAVRRRHIRQRLRALRVHVLPRHGQGDGRVRARAQAGRTSLLVGVGQARGEPVDVDRHAGDRDRGGAGAARPGRAEHVPVRGPGIRQCACTRPRGCATSPSGTSTSNS